MPEESHLLRHEADRQPEFVPNRQLDDLIRRLSRLLGPVEAEVSRGLGPPRLPVLAIVGCPRSGTTLLTQVLARSPRLFYPSNVLSRFAYAPHVGCLVQQLLFDPDYDLNGEFAGLRATTGYSSHIGKTAGALGVSEFFHFWRRFFPNHDPGHLTADELQRVDVAGLRRELAAIEAVSGRPFMSKAMMIQYNIADFAAAMPELFFVHVRRDPVYVMQSIAQARRRYYRDERIWWSVKPREYEWLKDLPPAAQTAGQVHFTEQAIVTQLATVDPARQFSLCYEDLCADPNAVLRTLAAKLAALGVQADLAVPEDRFACENTIRLPPQEIDQLRRYHADYAARMPQQP